MKNKLSVVIITKNEASNIGSCLDAAIAVSDDIWIIDSGSTDETINISREKGAHVVEGEWKGYGAMKNWGNSFCTNDWILSIDADEVLSPELIHSINQLSLKEDKVYLLDRITYYDGQWIKHCGWYPDWKPRLFNRNHARWLDDLIHEELTYDSSYKMSSVKLVGYLYHYSYPTLQHHLSKIDHYSKLSAEALFLKGKRSNFFKQYFSPIIRFLKTYFIKMGFRDGKAGWSIASHDALLVYKKYKLLKKMTKHS